MGEVRLIYDYEVTGAAKANIDTGVDGPMAGPFPTTLNYLEVFLSGRTDEAALISEVLFWFNNDTTFTNYDRIFIASSVGGSPIQGQVTAGLTNAGVIAADTSAANVPGLCRLFMPNYNGSTFFKVCEFTSWTGDTVPALAGYQIGLESFLWENTAAITRLMAEPDIAGVKFKVGTRMTIWAR